MATLDISSALNAMVHASTPQAQMERNMGLAMFSGRVDAVLDNAQDKLKRAAVELKALGDDEIDEDIKAFLLDSYKDRVTTAQRFNQSYFG